MDTGSLVVGGALGLLLGVLWAWRMQARAVRAETALAESSGRITQLEKHNADLAATQQQHSDLGALLQPVAERLDAVHRATSDADRRRVEAETQIRSEIEYMRTASESLGSATRQLVAAMAKGQSRGQWGEMQLEQLLEHAGLIEGTHFHRQHTRAGEGGAVRPDLVVQLPGGGEILVDAKFPWDAFFEAMGTDDPHLRRPLLEKHARDLLARVNDLARKDYTATSAMAPDFVVLFLPLEPLLSTALDQDGLLLERAFGRKVIPATPTTMLALLRTIGFAWNRHDLAVNAEEIRSLSSEMLERLGKTVKHLNGMGDQLQRTVEAYNSLVGNFDLRVASQARRIAALGLPTKEGLDVRPELGVQIAQSRTPSVPDDLEDEAASRTLTP